LVTGKSKYLQIQFTATTIDDVDYEAKEYWNVRAIVVRKMEHFMDSIKI